MGPKWAKLSAHASFGGATVKEMTLLLCKATSTVSVFKSLTVGPFGRQKKIARIPTYIVFTCSLSVSCSFSLPFGRRKAAGTGYSLANEWRGWCVVGKEEGRGSR